MRKHLLILLSVVLAFSMILAGCGGNNSGNTGGNNGGSAAPANNGGGEASAEATELELWTFNELHQKYFEYMAGEWNTKNPDKQINLKASTFPFDDTHNKLLVALQSGTGAPDMADIELSKFPNYLKGEPQLLPLNDVVDPERANIVPSRLEIYSKDGQNYGLPFHVGASVIYYNTEILGQAGVDPAAIKTWADYEAAAKTVLEKTGKPMTTLEVADQWSFWPQVAQIEGPDELITADGKVNIDGPQTLQVLEYQQNLIKNGYALAAPGNIHHAEEYYGFMNQGGAASIWMPMWYMGRFIEYMPDLQGKIAIMPMPAWTEGGPRSAGMGGTGTVVTNQSENPDLAKEFLAYAKLSVDGNLQLWKQLGFDPPRTDVWEMPELKEANKYTDYFGPDIFDTLVDIKGEIEGVNITEDTPAVFDAVDTQIVFRALVDMEDPAAVLEDVAIQLK
jgi:arabinosaccharide transport system substrate-binding protein